jgi:hypothetical protein
MGRGERKPLADQLALIEMLRMSELLKEHPISNWLVASPVPRVRDSLRCDGAERRKRVKVAGTTLLRVLLALVAAVTWCTTRGHPALIQDFEPLDSTQPPRCGLVLQ